MHPLDRDNGRKTWPSFRVKWLMPALLLMSSVGLGEALAQDRDATVAYRLDTEDRVRLRIFEWRPALDQVYEWRALNDEYAVGMDGNVSVPMIGEIMARGRTTSELGRRLAEAMRSSIGAGDPPTIAVEVVRYRPFYILGNVRLPGEYPFRPNLTVLQAVSIAGGMQREEAGGSRLARELIANQGDIETLTARRRYLLAQRAATEATMANAEEIDFSRSGLDAKDPLAVAVMNQANEIYRARRADYLARLADHRTRKSFLEQEMRTIVDQIENQDAKRALASNELEFVDSLVDRRLAAVPRRMAAQRNMHELEAEKLQLQAARLRLRGEIDRVTAAVDELVKSQNSEAMTALGAANEELQTLLTRTNTAKRLVADASSMLVSLGLAAGPSAKVKPIYTIVRSNGSSQSSIVVSELQPLSPGDTLKVEVEVDDPAPASGHGAPAMAPMSSTPSQPALPQANATKPAPVAATGTATGTRNRPGGRDVSREAFN
jgi:polysaccharide export outer membrane protein/exopolysaccharide production protein ExoF